jgi:hypothetical protein
MCVSADQGTPLNHLNELEKGTGTMASRLKLRVQGGWGIEVVQFGSNCVLTILPSHIRDIGSHVQVHRING